MNQTSQRIAAIEKAIAGWRRVTGAYPIGLTRYLNTLYRVQAWERKEKLAKTKLKIYRRKVQYYQKKVGV